jgi:tetratricopeptide (TPR) repeat protein
LSHSDDRHLDARDVHGLLARSLSLEDRRRVIGHLIGDCDACRERVKEELRREREMAAAYGRAVDAACEAAIAESGRLIAAQQADLGTGALLWRELRELPAGRRLTIVGNSRRYRTAGVLRALLRDYREGLWRDPGKGVEIAELGVAIAMSLDGGKYRASWLADLRGEAVAIAGNAQRLAGRPGEAAKLLHQAAKLLSGGSGDPLLTGQLLAYEGSRWLSLGSFKQAARAFGRAEQTYRRIGEVHLAARSMVARAEAIGNLDPERAIRLIRRALPDIDVSRDPQLELAAHHHLAWYLNDAGRQDEAWEEAGRSADLYQRASGDALASLSRAWLKGRIDRSRQELEQARRFYERAWAGFVELGMESHLAMLAVDRAELEAAEGDFASGAWLLARTLVLLKRWGASREALGVLRLLGAEVKAGRCERARFRQASLAVRRAWGRLEAGGGAC